MTFMAIGRPKKMMNMYILDILKRNTDIDHAITQKEIQQRLETEYNIRVSNSIKSGFSQQKKQV